MKRKGKERLKSLLILLLAALAVFLAHESRVFHEFVSSSELLQTLAERFGGESSAGIVGPGSTAETAARPAHPVLMALTSGLGARLGAAYDEAAVDELYERCASLFGEALGSAAPPEPCTREEWLAALERPGFFLDYQTELPLWVLPHWLGVSAVTLNQDTASRFAVSLSGEGSIELYYRGAKGYARCATASAAESLRQITAELLPNGAYFAFEGGAACEQVEPDTLLLPELSEKRALTREILSGQSALREQIAAALGMSALGGAAYSERDGTLVYVGGSGTLRFQPDGLVLFNRTDSGDGAPAPEDRELIDAACALLAELRGSATGEERLCFDGLLTEPDGSRTLLFAAYVDGVRVGTEGHAARLRYEGGQLASLELSLCRYSAAGEALILLPPLQAAAIAGGLSPGSSPFLSYEETENGLVPVWTAREDK